MSLTSRLITPKAMLDTTVLCGALLTNGVNYKLLKAAALGIYQPVISNVCLLEFVRNAANGFKVKGKIRLFDWNTIDSFLEGLIFPAIQEGVANSTVSRNSYGVIKRLTKNPSISVGQAILEIVDLTNVQARLIVKQREMKLPLERFDTKDFHVWSTALITECQYIVTKNTYRFPTKIGPVKRIDPVDFYQHLL